MLMHLEKAIKIKIYVYIKIKKKKKKKKLKMMPKILNPYRINHV